MTTEAEEVEELRGRLASLMVNFPDVEPRVRKTVELLSVLITHPQHPGLMQFVVNDLLTLQVQIAAVYEKFPELRKSIQPIIELLNRLLQPVETQTLH